MENSTYTTSRNNIFLSYIAFVLFSGFWYVFGIIVAFNLGKFTLRWIESTGSFRNGSMLVHLEAG